MSNPTERLSSGDEALPFSVVDMNGDVRSLEDYRGKTLLLSFYRYAACPLCNLRIHELGKHREKFLERGLLLLAVFQSPESSMRQHLARRAMPFPIVADPERRLYRAYRIESSFGAFATAMVHPRSVSALVQGFLPGKMEGDKFLVPADFLVGPELTIQHAYYGKHIGDHIPMQTIIDFIDG